MSRIATIWNADKINFLVENYAHASNRKLADTLGVSIPSVKIKARELGLKKECAKRKIFPSLEANILRMSENCSYRTIADKLNISVSSVHCAINDAATKGFRKRSREKTGKIMSEARVRLIKKERARAVFGLNQKTKIKLFPNKKKYHMRDRLKRCRYEVEHNGTDVYIDDETRRHANIEAEAQKMGFTIQLPFIVYYPLEFVTENGEAEDQIFTELRRKNIHG
ncbi:hypothetical protein [Prevotella corporis]|uniref:hypothetical protein n=1 Tax=Prevotella corporis TaxID=28128 RepID=UPI002367096F|nr:hypothetical protein [Prevotella corporis]